MRIFEILDIKIKLSPIETLQKFSNAGETNTRTEFIYAMRNGKVVPTQL